MTIFDHSEFSISGLITGVLLFLPFFVMYAETHYHFRFAPSLIYRRHPEIVADAPHRLDPGEPAPILIMVKDAHRFPIELLTITATCWRANRAARKPVFARRLFDSPEAINRNFWWRVFEVELPREWSGLVEVDIEITYRRTGRRYLCRNDNYAGTSHRPLEIHRAEQPLPSFDGYFHGDLHCHTFATSDQVEFGAPVEAMVSLARAQGLHFFAATDHSYDLDDLPDNYLVNDPELTKWTDLQNRIRDLNRRQNGVIVIPGEEVSCGNARGENVHFLILNHPAFIRGRGDGGERWLHHHPDHSIREILAMIDDNALAYAAHPAARVPRLEARLLNRGHWHWQDLQDERLNGVQFWNGSELGREEGFAQWRRLLLSGKKSYAIAGNDAHGNFNRYRQIAFPCLRIAENFHHVFGRMRTAVRCQGNWNFDSLLACLREGRNCITTGPIVDLEWQSGDGATATVGEDCSPGAGRIRLRAKSSPEFGRMEKVVVWRGRVGAQQEEPVLTIDSFRQPYELETETPLHDVTGSFFIRAQLICAPVSNWMVTEHRHQCLTNPIWVG